MKKKDIFKNITLTLLVCSSVLLCLYIFMGSQLWPSGYNFFIGGNFGFVGKIISAFAASQTYDSPPLSSVIKPSRIVITNNSKRAVILSRDDSFKKLSESLNTTLLAIGSKTGSGKLQALDDEEWFKSLKSNSILIDYGISVPVSLWQETAGFSHLEPEFDTVRDIIISPGDSVSGKIRILFADAKSGNKYILQTDTDNEKTVALMNTATEKAQSGSYPFSFELSFDGRDKTAGQKVVQKVLLDSHITINLSDDALPVVRATHPFNSSMQSGVDNLTRLFGFRAGASKRYVEMNNSLLYVENYANLRVSADGTVEYQAVESDKGLKLFDGNKDMAAPKAISESLKAGAGLVQHIGKMLGGQDIALELSDISYDPKTALCTFSFHYSVNGIPYYFGTSNRDVQENAATISVLNGRVQSLKQYVLGFDVQNTKTTAPLFLKALDKIDTSGTSQVQISDAVLAYVDNGTADPGVYWCARIKDREGIVPMR